MALSEDLQELSSAFERIAHKSNKDNMARLTSPGVEGVQVLLESVFIEKKIAVQEIRSCFEDKKWTDRMSYRVISVCVMAQS